LSKLGQWWEKQTISTKLAGVLLPLVAVGTVLMMILLNFTLHVSFLNSNNDVTGWGSLLIGTAIGTYITFAILIYSDVSQNQIQEFAKEQKSIKEAKRKRYSMVILFGLKLIDYEIDGVVIHQRFRDNHDARGDKQLQSRYYENAQKRFLDMKIEYDDVLEIFNETIENQYRKAWDALRTPSLYVNFDKSETIWGLINKITQAFAELKNSLIEYVDADEKNTYSDLFDPQKYKKDDNARSSTT